MKVELGHLAQNLVGIGAQFREARKIAGRTRPMSLKPRQDFVSQVAARQVRFLVVRVVYPLKSMHLCIAGDLRSGYTEQRPPEHTGMQRHGLAHRGHAARTTSTQ